MTTKVKICGLKTEAALEAALAGGADYVGLVFFPPSPRNVTPAVGQGAGRQGARPRQDRRPDGRPGRRADRHGHRRGGRPDLLQLHGEETPERVADIRRRWGIPVMKAIKVETADDARARARLPRGRRPHPVRRPRPGRQHAPRRQRRALRLAHAARRQGRDCRSCSRAASRPTTSPRPSASPARRSSMSPRASRSSPGEKDPELIRRFLRAAKGHRSLRRWEGTRCVRHGARRSGTAAGRRLGRGGALRRRRR